jgi:hypothetical protein
VAGGVPPVDACGVKPLARARFRNLAKNGVKIEIERRAKKKNQK